RQGNLLIGDVAVPPVGDCRAVDNRARTRAVGKDRRQGREGRIVNEAALREFQSGMERSDCVSNFLDGVRPVTRRQVGAKLRLILDLGDWARQLGMHESGGRLAKEEGTAVYR